MDPKIEAERLAELYADAILRLSYTYLKNTHDAQDICQTVFLKFLLHPVTFETPRQERAYLLRMAANACKDLLKSAWYRRTCALEEGEHIPTPAENYDDSVLELVNRLPEKYRVVIYLHYYEGLTAKEIGAICKLPAATVNTRLKRGREKLKQELGGNRDACI